MAERRRRRISEGIYRDQWGYAAKVQFDGQAREKRYPPNAELKTMQRWRAETRVSLMAASDRAARGTFAEDVERYLKTVQHLTTYAERERHMALWCETFGRRRRDSIETHEITAVLSEWLTAGLSASAVRHRRSALLHLWNTLDGKDEKNPVRSALNPRPPRAEARGLSYRTIERILEKMPDQGRGVAGAPRGEASQTKARLRVIAYTGLPQASLMRLRPEDIDYRRKQLVLRPRRKGEGTDTLIVPLVPQAIAALKVFAALDCWGEFSVSAMYASFKRACKAANVQGVRPYDLRHSFGTMIYDQTGDLRAAQLMLAHASQVTTTRYTKGAEARRLVIAAKAVAGALPQIGVAVRRGSPKRKAEKSRKTA